jgi:hypothetical protein
MSQYELGERVLEDESQLPQEAEFACYLDLHSPDEADQVPDPEGIACQYQPAYAYLGYKHSRDAPNNRMRIQSRIQTGT